MAARRVSVFGNYNSKFAGGTLQGAKPSSTAPSPGVNTNKLGAGASFVPDPCKPKGKGTQPSVQKIYTTNPVSLPNIPSTLIMLYNPNRTRFTITNVGTTIVYIALGRPATASNYDHSLPGCTNANDGTGGVIIDEDFIGDVWAIPSGTGGTIAITEQP